MERLNLKASEIFRSEINYKHDDLVMFEKLKTSLKMFGQIRPINVYKHEGQYVCFEGKNILKAILELGNELGFEFVECNIFNFADDGVYKGLHLILNEVHFKKCDVEISKILNSLSNPDAGLLPFTKEEIDSFMKLLNFDWEEFERTKTELKQTSLFDSEL